MITDTIAAIITAIGASSVGIIRLSGPDAIAIGDRVYKGKTPLTQVESHTVNYGKVYNRREDKVVDEGLFLVMKGPRSFTGEDIVEIQCHGGSIVIQKVLKLVINEGARLAEEGEFSKRAFINGKFDLAQAEAIMDIVNAKTEKSLDLAVTQLQGNLSQKVIETRAELLELIAFIEADIDFPDDDIERLTEEQQEERVSSIRKQLADILATSHKGKMIRDGLKVVIVGKPNVGKSSLLNALLGENRAIVTDIPGTTRDVIEEYINLNGIPLKVIDTAGIRETDNIVEKIGVDKAKDFLKTADLVLYVLEPELGVTDEDKEIMDSIEGKPVIYLLNKSDLALEDIRRAEIQQVIGNHQLISISAKEQMNLSALEDEILSMFFQGSLEVGQEVIITNIRHITVLEEAIDHLNSVLSGLEMGMPGDFLAIDLKSTWEKLGKITGETIEDDLLDQIFANFCLGK